MARLFFALWPPAELATRLAEIARQAADKVGGRPTRPETIHLTLAFLGETDVSCLPELHALAERIQGERFVMEIDRLGCWHHNHLLWAGFNRMPQALDDLRRGLQARLKHSGYRTDSPGRPFAPHITLLRKLPAGATASNDDQLPLTEGLAWLCDRFVLVRSEPVATGRAYRILGEYPLG